MIEIFPEVSSTDVLGRSEEKPKIDNAGSGIDRLVMLFDGKVYKPGNQFLTR